MNSTDACMVFLLLPHLKRVILSYMFTQDAYKDNSFGEFATPLQTPVTVPIESYHVVFKDL